MGKKVAIFGMSQNWAPPCLLFALLVALSVLSRKIAAVEVKISRKTDSKNLLCSTRVLDQLRGGVQTDGGGDEHYGEVGGEVLCVQLSSGT